MNDQTRRIALEPAAESPRDVASARQAVASSRARISATVDELEERISDKKQALRDRLDVVRPVRTFVGASPLVAMVAAVGAGLLLGIATGGRHRHGDLRLKDEDSAAIRQWRHERRKRLLDTAEAELPRFEPPPSRLGRLFRDLAHDLAGAGTALLVSRLVGRVRDEED